MKLMLFFNGWGMDENIVSHLEIPINYTLKVINFPYNFDNTILSQYDDIIFIGWSFGSYYLTKYVIENNIKSNKIISLNGTPETIGKNGISEGVFKLTLDTLTPDTLQNIFTHAFIGKKDKIIPASRQKKYFETNKVIITELLCGHYPFSVIKSWNALIGE